MSPVELARFQISLDALARGVSQMNETLALHGAMLEEILKAASLPPPKSELGDTLKTIAALLTEQGATLTVLDDRLADLPEQIARALTEDA